MIHCCSTKEAQFLQGMRGHQVIATLSAPCITIGERKMLQVIATIK